MWDHPLPTCCTLVHITVIYRLSTHFELESLVRTLLILPMFQIGLVRKKELFDIHLAYPWRIHVSVLTKALVLFDPLLIEAWCWWTSFDNFRIRITYQWWNPAYRNICWIWKCYWLQRLWSSTQHYPQHRRPIALLRYSNGSWINVWWTATIVRQIDIECQT